jgi:acetyl-CoA carboxylase, biotin carboxylase subunit
LKKILIANRGEIAVRVIRTCRDMGLGTVAVYSACDRPSLHVRMAGEAYAIGPDEASESYLRVDKLIDVARRSGADGVHPGYGFLAENPDFAEACAKAGLTFIGPSAKVLRAVGSKTAAREIAARAGVPVVPGSDSSLSSEASEAELAAAAETIGYPVLVKAVAGGGGKGMRVAVTPEDLPGAVRLARSEAQSSFGDDRLYLERRLERARHIEVQLLGDAHGTVVPFVERECSIQRRHQKLIEETPSPVVTAGLREQLTAAAAAIGRAAGYTNAGTVEFLIDATGAFFFLEMNARLQVEHPITEAVTGVDFVRAQIEIAQGAKVGSILADLKVGTTNSGDVVPAFRPANGHAIEVRVYAENPHEGFLPSPGLITHLRVPSGPGIRDDSAAFEGWSVPTAYDPLVSKVTAWAPNRPRAIARMLGALTEYDVRGISTTIQFCRELIESPAFAAAEFDTSSVDRMLEGPPKRTAEAARHQVEDEMEETAAIAAALREAKRQPTDVIEAPEVVEATPAIDTPDPIVAVEVGRTVPSGVRPGRQAESLWAQRGRLENLR